MLHFHLLFLAFFSIVATSHQINRINSSRIQKVQAEAQPLLDVSFHPLNISINVLLNIEAVLNPTSAIEPIVENLLIIERMQVSFGVSVVVSMVTVLRFSIK